MGKRADIWDDDDVLKLKARLMQCTVRLLALRTCCLSLLSKSVNHLWWNIAQQTLQNSNISTICMKRQYSFFTQIFSQTNFSFFFLNFHLTVFRFKGFHVFGIYGNNLF